MAFLVAALPAVGGVPGEGRDDLNIGLWSRERRK
jgi:hypothetical protein